MSKNNNKFLRKQKRINTFNLQQHLQSYTVAIIIHLDRSKTYLLLLKRKKFSIIKSN